MQSKRIITFAALSLLSLLRVQAQERVTVSGKISGVDGEPLTGAMVVVSGGQGNDRVYSIADLDGKYSIVCRPDDVLEFHFLGMRDELVKLSGRTVLDMVMQPDVNMTLDGAVAIGYGTVRLEDLTGSVANVKMQEIRDTPVSSVDQALQGKVAGADIMTTTGEPGATTSIRIRGTRSISASNEPLIVVDGVMDAITDLNDVNPADIEDITVLKDASSTAIYGARGANGVILITTKAQAGSSSSKPRITFKASAGVSVLPFKPDMMDASEFSLYRNDYAYFIGSYGLTKPVSSMTVADPLSKGKGTDWIDEITQAAPYQNYYISASGGVKTPIGSSLRAIPTTRES